MGRFTDEGYLRQKASTLSQGLLARLEEFVEEFPAGQPSDLIQTVKTFLTQIKLGLASTTDVLVLRWSCALIYRLSEALEWLDNAHTAQVPRGVVQLLHDTSRVLFGPKASVLVSPSTDYNYSIIDVVPYFRRLAERALPASVRQPVLDKLLAPFYVVRFPRIERDNVLVHALFGHELGHPIADEFIASHETQALYQTRFQDAQRKALAHPEISSKLALVVNPIDRKKVTNRLFDDIAKIHKRGLQELVSDAVAVILFGPSAAFSAIDVLGQSPLDDAPMAPEYYPPTRYRWRLMLKILSERHFLDQLRSMSFRPELDETKQATISGIEYMESAASLDLDRQAIDRNPIVSIAYEWISATLPDALRSAETRVQALAFSKDRMTLELPELLERLWLKVPPCEMGVWPAIGPIDWRSALLAGWLMSISHATDSSLTADERQNLLSTNNRLTLKGIEMALLRKEFDAHTSAQSGS